MSGVHNNRLPSGTEGIWNNRFQGCGTVPQTDPLRPYFGSESASAVVLNFVDGVSLVGNQTTAHPACNVRLDYGSSSNTGTALRSP
jgi:hypothetical protein